MNRIVALQSSSYNLDTIDKLPIKYDGLEKVLVSICSSICRDIRISCLIDIADYYETVLGSDFDNVLSSKLSALTAGILLTAMSPSMPRASPFQSCLLYSPCLSIPEAVTLSPGSLGLTVSEWLPLQLLGEISSLLSLFCKNHFSP